uniref:S1 motif domain-containing protein n=1 Tax=Pinguiococcus pyrenoidosus TaxID=172671 RepID=A0A7R9UCG9_9STRA|mmetsp:Transcript_5471/g.21631  ORF Transcript_5471/g.21631 Transcript_5471/m.21631 type:complete len:432 (+) Transcript_5471:85-1380(+)
MIYKVGTVLAVLALGHAFVPARPPVRNSVIVKMSLETADAEVEGAEPGPLPPTRFTNLAAKWKGQVLREETDEELAGFSYDDFENIFEDTLRRFVRGDRVTGSVVQIDPEGALVEIGAKSTALLTQKEAGLRSVGSVENVVSIGEEREFEVIGEDQVSGQLLVSIKQIEFREAWDRMIQYQAEDVVMDATVLGTNRGGCLVDVEGIRGFMPGSHLSTELNDDLVGKTFRVKFLQVDPELGKLVVSNRRAILEEQMASVGRGDLLEGEVKAVKPYGAFVDVNGISALLHISQISYDRVSNIEKVFEVGMRIKCMVVDHDKAAGRIALSTRTLEPEPGDMLRDPQKVFDNAEASAEKWRERMEAEKKAREEAAKDIVSTLGEGLGLGGAEDDKAESLDTVLSEVTGEGDAAAQAGAVDAEAAAPEEGNPGAQA